MQPGAPECCPAASFWVTALTTDLPDEMGIWIAVGISTLIALLAVVWARKGKPDGYKESRARVAAFESTVCPLCEGHVVKSLDSEACQQCAAEHRPLAQATNAVHMP